MVIRQTKYGTADRRYRHGMRWTSVYRTWKGMKTRCYNPNDKRYPRYGGRGIKVCARWLDSFDAFYRDMGDRPKGGTLDRINNNGDYSPDNCRWATVIEQNMNRCSSRPITAFGETKFMKEWSCDPRCVVGYGCFRQRIYSGHPPEFAMTQRYLKGARR